MAIGNFLSQILGPVGGPRQLPQPIPSIDPDTGEPISAPIMNGQSDVRNVLAELSAPDLASVSPTLSQDIAQFNPQQAQAPQQVPQQAQEAPRQRRSFLDTVGRISDVIARVGGAEAMYQPTLDAQEDRARSVDIGGLQRQLMEQQLQAGQGSIEAAGNAKLSGAIRGLQAIQRGGGDVAAAWPILAKQAGIPEERAVALGEIFTSNPTAINGLSSMFGDESEFGLQPFYAQDASGNLQAYQLGKNGEIKKIQLGEGESAIDPIKFLDVGGANVGYGTRTGRTQTIIPNTQSPDNRANIGSRERIAAAGNKSREAIAAAKDGKDSGSNSASAQNVINRLEDIRGAVEALDQLGALVSPDEGWGTNLIRSARASGAGQLAEGAVGTQAQEQRDLISQTATAVMFQMKQALGLSARDLDTNQDVQRALATINNPRTTKANMLKAVDTLQREFRSIADRAASQPQAPATRSSAAMDEARRRGLIQ